MKTAEFSLALFITIAAVLVTGCSDEDDAASSSGGGSSSTNGSLGDTEPTGKISADGFFILYDPGLPEIVDAEGNFVQQEVTVTVFAEDVNDLVELNGHTVNFRTEWGAFLDGRDSCELSNGACSVTWRSGNPATIPGSCLVSFTAWAEGEEGFVDANDNDLFDVGETLADQGEPFLDIDFDGNYNSGIITVEGVVELIDIINFTGSTPGSKSGDHDVGNNLYDGSLCASNNTANCSGRTAQIIHTRSQMLIRAPESGVVTPCSTNAY